MSVFSRGIPKSELLVVKIFCRFEVEQMYKNANRYFNNRLIK